ncbi:hypothetical protein [Burkholderia pseudomultivorans]|uniref:hypothetical protein n=1 Tax=Burkholderia pseudomultivorans TaxID=1207504 RepID=UPI00188F4A5E|nr:hypothetical protein [Burkholderia pseudomultivorans]MBF5008014.1 hypothetical protein [Burkholderia pseudomultivorans]
MVMHRHVRRSATDDLFLKIVPDRSAYILLMMLVGGWSLIIAILCVLFVGGWQAYKFLILSISIELVLFAYIKRNFVVLRNDVIVVRSLFFTKHIPISGLVGVRLEGGMRKYTDRFGPTFRLVFVVDVGDVVLNAKLYGSEDLDLIIEFAESRISRVA